MLREQRLIAAMRLHVQGQVEAAFAEYEALAREWPEQPEVWHGMGVIHLQRCQSKEAAECFHKALKANPRSVRHLLPLARAYMQAGDTKRAFETLGALLKVEPTHAEAAELLQQLGVEHIAGKICPPLETLIAAHPKIMQIRLVALKLYQDTKAYAQTLTHLEALYRQGVRSESLYTQYAVALRDNGRYKRGLEICNEALAAYPNAVDLLKLRSGLYLILGQTEASLADIHRNLVLKPRDVHAQTSVGIIKLLTSNGFDGFEEFSAHRDHEIEKRSLQFSLPEWHGEPLSGKHLLVWSSQGVGDIVMFASFLPWVTGQGARVTLAIYPKLVPLFTRAFPDIRIVPYSPATGTHYSQECDFHTIIGQLMRYALPGYIPAQHPPYLKADSLCVQRLREQYRRQFPEAKKLIGISWHTTNQETFAMRNIALDLWKGMFALSQVQCISLQYGDHAADIEAVNRDFPGALYADPTIDAFDDLDALAAQMAAMDEIISIDNTTVHMGGALGVPTTLLLSASSDWRWGLTDRHSRWYKSLTIERQQKLLEWKPVMKKIAERLGEYSELK